MECVSVLRGRSPVLWKGLTTGGRACFATVAHGDTLRSTHDSAESEYARLQSTFSGRQKLQSRLIRSVYGLSEGDYAPFGPVIPRPTSFPDLFRYVAPKYADTSPDRMYSMLQVHTRDLMSASSEKSWNELAAGLHKSVNSNSVSTICHLPNALNEVLTIVPSAEYAAIVLDAIDEGSKLRWTLKGLSRHNLRDEAENVPTFMFSLPLWHRELPKIGAYHNAGLLAEFQIRPKFSSVLVDSARSGENSPQSIDDAALELLRGLRRALADREYTSVVSRNEAAALHFQKSFPQTILGQYVQLQHLRFSCHASVSPDDHRILGINESFHCGNPYMSPMGSWPLSRVSRRSCETSPTTANSNKAHVDRKAYERIQVLGRSYTLDISLPTQLHTAVTTSAVASHLETNLAEHASMDLPFVVDSFLSVLQGLPSDFPDPVAVKITPESAELTTNVETQVIQPKYSVALEKASQAESASVSVCLDLHKSFRLRFNDPTWTDRKILVKQVLLKMSPIDAFAVSSLLKKPAKERVQIPREIHHLGDSAATIFKKVCDGVKFDDPAAVPAMLAEAVLRVVRPLTTICKLEQVSLRVVIGDDPVTLTKTVSLADLAARLRKPQIHMQALDHIEFPSGYVSSVPQRSPIVLTKNIRETGFDSGAVQLISPSTASYESISPLDKFMGTLDAALGTTESTDLFALLESTRKALDDTVTGVEASLSLFGRTQRGKNVLHACIYSHGEVFLRLPVFNNVSTRHESFRSGELTSVSIEIWLRGTPSQQAESKVTSKQQMALIHGILAPKITAFVDGLVFRNPQESASKISEVILKARHDFAEHIAVDLVSVGIKIAKPARRDEATIDLNKDDDVASRDGEISPLKQVDGCDRMPKCEHTAPLEELLRELDLKLLYATSTSSGLGEKSNQSMLPTKSNTDEPSRSDMQRGVVIALGSNVGNRIEEIEKACRAIDADPDMRIVDTSFLYETKPMYVEDQETFVNGACEIETSLSPIELLDRLQAIERGHGRVKLIDKGPRNIDLDIAIFRDEVVDSERLTIPHALMHEREFVLRPISDLQSLGIKNWGNPRGNDTKRTVIDMLKCILKQPERNASEQEQMRLVMPLAEQTLMYPVDPVRKTRIMSILNTTPDSFSDGGINALDMQSLRKTAATHIAAGATIIDVGGQSSRPNAPDVTAEEEISRVLPAIAAIRSLPEAEKVAISVDTYRASVAEVAVKAGAHIVNDISAGTMDPQMLSTVARLGCTYIMMHMRGTPATMQSAENCVYPEGVHGDVHNELSSRVAAAIASGVRKWRIVIDPGIGFAKNQEHNLALLYRPLVRRDYDDRKTHKASRLRAMPQLVGCSRKGFIGKITGVAEPKDRIWGTAAAITASIAGGADIVRVHDVKEMVQVAKMADAIYRVKGGHPWT